MPIQSGPDAYVWDKHSHTEPQAQKWSVLGLMLCSCCLKFEQGPLHSHFALDSKIIQPGLLPVLLKLTILYFCSNGYHLRCCFEAIFVHIYPHQRGSSGKSQISFVVYLEEWFSQSKTDEARKLLRALQEGTERNRHLQRINVKTAKKFCKLNMQ